MSEILNGLRATSLLRYFTGVSIVKLALRVRIGRVSVPRILATIRSLSAVSLLRVEAREASLRCDFSTVSEVGSVSELLPLEIPFEHHSLSHA